MKTVMKLATAGLWLIASDAHANWQYTRWGMSPEEFVRASSGQARLVADVLGKSRNGLSTYQSGTQTFDVSGCFDGKRSLQMVALSIKSPASGIGADVRGALITKYGRPTVVRGPGSLAWTGTGGTISTSMT